NWNGSSRVTTFVSSSRLTVAILASDIATPHTTSVTVVNPTPGGGTSNVVFFSITVPASPVSFNLSDLSSSGGGADSVAEGDFNRDGKLDLACTSYSSNKIAILLGNGDGTFQNEVDYAVGPGADAIAVGDFNRDGKLDLAVTDNNGVSILLGNGDGSFNV